MTDSSAPASDRRARAGFRALIDEMMAQIRAVSRQEEWTPEARAAAEADLERIMASVRREAIRARVEEQPDDGAPSNATSGDGSSGTGSG